MKHSIVRLTFGFLLGWVLIAAAQQPATRPVEPSERVLERGPVHEAFAEVISFDPKPGVIVPRRPADPIQELPPSARPAGSRVQWIPGYWAWDDERNDFLWVSGGWRNAPPNRRWIPGYWLNIAQGYQWVSGFWASVSAGEIEYLPAPPASVEEGPTSSVPSPNHFWIPGSWVWRDANYFWRPGYWWQASPGWIWTPAHYRHTPRGIVYVEGYWDFDLGRRGHLYAPIYYTQPVHAQTGYYHRPTSLLELGLLTASLFVNREHQHYYYGDYYAQRDLERGYQPWFGYGSARPAYDPFYSYHAWQHRQRDDRDWRTRLEREYEQRRNNPTLRPPRESGKANETRETTAQSIVRMLDDAQRDRSAGAPVTEVTRERIEQMRQLRRDRREAEQSGRHAGVPVKGHSPKQPQQTRPIPEVAKKTNPPGDSAAARSWTIPKAGQAIRSEQIIPKKYRLPDRPKPPKQDRPADQKTGPNSRQPKVKSKSEK